MHRALKLLAELVEKESERGGGSGGMRVGGILNSLSASVWQTVDETKQRKKNKQKKNHRTDFMLTANGTI